MSPDSQDEAPRRSPGALGAAGAPVGDPARSGPRTSCPWRTPSAPPPQPAAGRGPPVRPADDPRGPRGRGPARRADPRCGDRAAGPREPRPPRPVARDPPGPGRHPHRRASAPTRCSTTTASSSPTATTRGQRPGGPTQYDLNITYPLDVTRQARSRGRSSPARRSACWRRSTRTPSGSRSTTSTRPSPTCWRRARRSGSPRRPAQGLESLLDRTRGLYAKGTRTIADVSRIEALHEAAEVELMDARGGAPHDEAEPRRPAEHARAREAEAMQIRGLDPRHLPAPAAGRRADPRGAGVPARRRRLPARDRPRRGRGPARPGQPAVRRLPALPALHLPEQRARSTRRVPPRGRSA